jgi:hypothetical protein
MSSTITAIAIVVLCGVWHLHNRRHAGWRASPDGRFYVCLGYPLVAVAVYCMTAAPTTTTWEWAMGSAWALAAASSFVAGFGALNCVTAAHAPRAVEMETIEPATGAIQI